MRSRRHQPASAPHPSSAWDLLDVVRRGLVFGLLCTARAAGAAASPRDVFAPGPGPAVSGASPLPASANGLAAPLAAAVQACAPASALAVAAARLASPSPQRFDLHGNDTDLHDLSRFMGNYPEVPLLCLDVERKVLLAFAEADGDELARVRLLNPTRPDDLPEAVALPAFAQATTQVATQAAAIGFGMFAGPLAAAPVTSYAGYNFSGIYRRDAAAGTQILLAEIGGNRTLAVPTRNLTQSFIAEIFAELYRAAAGAFPQTASPPDPEPLALRETILPRLGDVDALAAWLPRQPAPMLAYTAEGRPFMLSPNAAGASFDAVSLVSSDNATRLSVAEVRRHFRFIDSARQGRGALLRADAVDAPADLQLVSFEGLAAPAGAASVDVRTFPRGNQTQSLPLARFRDVYGQAGVSSLAALALSDAEPRADLAGARYQALPAGAVLWGRAPGVHLAQVVRPELSCIVTVAAALVAQDPPSAGRLLRWSADGNQTHVDACLFRPVTPDSSPLCITLRATLPMRDGQAVTSRFVYDAQKQPVVGMPLLLEALVRANQQTGNLNRGIGLAALGENSASNYMQALTGRNATLRAITDLDDLTLSRYLGHVHDGLLVVVNSGDSNIPGPLEGEAGVSGIVENFFYNVVDSRGRGDDATSFLLRNPLGERAPGDHPGLAASRMGQFWLSRDEVRRSMKSIALGETETARFLPIDPRLAAF